MIKNTLLIAITGLLFVGCNQTENETKTFTKDLSKITQMDFFLGDWQNISNDGKFYESWKKTNDTLYSGVSYLIVGNDTTFKESIALELRNNELYYIPSVSNQNGNDAVSFKLVKTENNEYVFENKNHDFPEQIIYTKTTSDSLKARIEGNINGKFTRQDFPMEKRK